MKRVRRSSSWISPRPLFDFPYLIILDPSFNEQRGLHVAYLTRSNTKRIISGAYCWQLPKLPWAIIERIWRRGAMLESDLRPEQICTREPLADHHLTPLVDGGDLDALDLMRALAWAERHRGA